MDLKWMGEDSKLMLLGGIMINMDDGSQDRFVPLTFESRDKNGVATNLMSHLNDENIDR